MSSAKEALRVEAASKSWLLFSRHQEALEETPPLSKALAGTLTCNGSARGQQPASPPGQAQQAGGGPRSTAPGGSLPGPTTRGGWAGGPLGTSQRPVSAHPWAPVTASDEGEGRKRRRDRQKGKNFSWPQAWIADGLAHSTPLSSWD